MRPDRTHRIGSLARTSSRAAVSNSVVPCPGQARVGRGFLFEFGRAPGVTPESRPGVPGGSRDSACTGPADLFEFDGAGEGNVPFDPALPPESRPDKPRNIGGSRWAGTGPADLFEFGAGTGKSARLDASTLPNRVGA